MTKPRLENLNVAAFDLMPSPEEIHARLPISERASDTVYEGREALKRILDRTDPRIFIIVGPCSIHDPVAGYDYAERLSALAESVRDTLCLVMRVYFEKPRTSTGWKGFINDPYMDDSFRIEEGIEKARAFLLKVAELGLPTATEALDPITPQYLGDLVAWTAIGARTSESQTHREMASGLSTPVGFKNGTDGDIQVAINAIQSAARSHSFLGLSFQGRSAIVRTQGNHVQPYRPPRRRRAAELRHGEHFHHGEGARQGGASAEHRRGLLACQLVQGFGAAAPCDVRLRSPGPRREPLHRRLDDRKQPRGGKPGDPGRPGQAEVRLFRNGPVRGLAHDGIDDSQGTRKSAGSSATPGPTGMIRPIQAPILRSVFPARMPQPSTRCRKARYSSGAPSRGSSPSRTACSNRSFNCPTRGPAVMPKWAMMA